MPVIVGRIGWPDRTAPAAWCRSSHCSFVLRGLGSRRGLVGDAQSALQTGKIYLFVLMQQVQLSDKTIFTNHTLLPSR